MKAVVWETLQAELKDVAMAVVMAVQWAYFWALSRVVAMVA
jgi:hypothetical protein